MSNVLSQREKRFLSEAGKQVNQINNLILKAHRGGVKDINVELGTHSSIVDSDAPVVRVNCTKPYKVQQKLKNTISITEVILRFPFVKLMVPLNEFIRKQYDGGIKHINIKIFEDDSTGEQVPQIYIGLREC